MGAHVTLRRASTPLTPSDSLSSTCASTRLLAAFMGCDELKSVKMNGVTWIGECAALPAPLIHTRNIQSGSGARSLAPFTRDPHQNRSSDIQRLTWGGAVWGGLVFP